MCGGEGGSSGEPSTVERFREMGWICTTPIKLCHQRVEAKVRTKLYLKPTPSWKYNSPMPIDAAKSV